jgi:hypothetical protein
MGDVMRKLAVYCLLVVAVTSLLIADLPTADADTGRILIYRVRRGHRWPVMVAPPRPVMYWGHQNPHQIYYPYGGYGSPYAQQSSGYPFSYSPGAYMRPNFGMPQQPGMIQPGMPGGVPQTAVNSPQNYNSNNTTLLNQNSGTQISFNGTSLPTPTSQQYSMAGRGFSFNESEQNAVIAWNGEEEILVLSTDEDTDVEGGSAVLSVLPLPGEPVSVQPASTELFTDACGLIQTKLGLIGRGEMLLDAKIGTHNIFVWRLDSPDDFGLQVRAYIKEQYADQADALITEGVEDVIKDYFDRGFEYFAFDLSFMGEEDATKVAIAYRFKTEKLYYPLVVSKIGGSDAPTRVRLAAFTPGLLHNFEGLDMDLIQTVGEKSVAVTEEELTTLDESLSELMGGGASARIFEIRGPLNGFEGDLLTW